jgi:mannose-6-phosphate isomerase-like protein (cupin superfamily)
MPVGPQGGGVRLKASEAETGGWCSVWEGRVEAGMVGAGLHFHRARDEFFFVLEGELELRLGEESQVVRAGTFAFVPRGTVHGFRNPGAETAALLVVHHPAGFERYFEELRGLLERGGSREDRVALAERFDMFSAS